MLKRLLLGPVLAGKKNKNMKTKTPGWAKYSGGPEGGGNIEKQLIFTVWSSWGFWEPWENSVMRCPGGLDPPHVKQKC